MNVLGRLKTSIFLCTGMMLIAQRMTQTHSVCRVNEFYLGLLTAWWVTLAAASPKPPSPPIMFFFYLPEASRGRVVINGGSGRTIIYSNPCPLTQRNTNSLGVNSPTGLMYSFVYVLAVGSLVSHHGNSCLKMATVMSNLEDQFSHSHCVLPYCF